MISYYGITVLRYDSVADMTVILAGRTDTKFRPWKNILHITLFSLSHCFLWIKL